MKRASYTHIRGTIRPWKTSGARESFFAVRAKTEIAECWAVNMVKLANERNVNTFSRVPRADFPSAGRTKACSRRSHRVCQRVSSRLLRTAEASGASIKVIILLQVSKYFA